MPYFTRILLITIANIERGVHGVLNKNKNYAKIFISRFYNHLSQKISCGRGIIFARGAHVRAIYRGTIFPSVGSSRFSVSLTGGMARRFAEQSEANRGHVLNMGSCVRY